MKASRALAALAALIVTGMSSVAAAQLVCAPGQGCKVVVQPPPLTYQPPPVTWQSPQVQVDPSIQAQAKWQAEIDRRARWDAYFQWRARVWASAQASINTQVYIEPLKYQARMTPDPLAYSGAGYGTPGNDYVSFPRAEIGFLALCLGAYSGSGAPMYAGYCPAVRFRFNARWAAAIDPAFVTSLYDDRSFGMFGLRPGVEYAFAHGRRELAASRAYVVGGLDLWFPTTGGATTPTAFLGGHVGLGAMISGGRWGFGSEVRALIRGGVGNGDDGFARAMSTFRVGFETRPFVLQLSFW
jgi:hypothetical protein